MSDRRVAFPLSTFVLASAWSCCEVFVLVVVAAPWRYSKTPWMSIGKASNELVESFAGALLGGVLAHWLLIATWLVVGVRAFQCIVDGERVFSRMRLVIFLLVNLVLMAMHSLLVYWVYASAALQGQAIVIVTFSTASLVLFRQASGLQIDRPHAGEKSAYGILGLMIFTTIVAITLSLASSLVSLASPAFTLAAGFGLVFGGVWLGAVCWLLFPRWFYGVFAVAGLLLLITFASPIGLAGSNYNADEVSAIPVFTISFFLHGLMFLGIAKAAGFTLRRENQPQTE